MKLKKGGTWTWGEQTIPVEWGRQKISLDVETFLDGSPRLIGLGVPGRTRIYHPSPTLYKQIAAHTGGFYAYSMNADRHFAGSAGFVFRDGVLDDPMLMIHLVDENIPSSLKETAPHFCGYPNWWSRIKGVRMTRDRDDIPDGEFAEYNAYDVQAALSVAAVAEKAFASQPQWERVYRHISRPLMEALYHTEKHGIPLDDDKTARYLDALRHRKVLLEDKLNHYYGDKPGETRVNWRSPTQVAALLYDRLGLPEQHNWKTDGRSTDMMALEALRGQHPIIEDAILYRKNDQRIKMLEGWRNRLRDGRLHSRYNGTGTVTGRLSGEDPNPQNFPRDRAIRSLIVAPPGMAIVAADYKTLEIGGGAWMYGEDELMKAYLTGDPHSITAEKLLGRPPKDKLERTIYGKTPNFRMLYQIKAPSFYRQGRKDGIEWTLQEAMAIHAAWHQFYPGVRLAWNRIGNILLRDGHLDTFSGRRRRLPEVSPEYSKAVRNHAWRQGTNAVVQTPCGEFCHAACIIAVDDLRHFGATLILDVHDSLVFVVPEEHSVTAAHRLKEIMEHEVPRYFAERLGRTVGIPLFAEVGIGPSWGECTEIH